MSITWNKSLKSQNLWQLSINEVFGVRQKPQYVQWRGINSYVSYNNKHINMSGPRLELHLVFTLMWLMELNGHKEYCNIYMINYEDLIVIKLKGRVSILSYGSEHGRKLHGTIRCKALKYYTVYWNISAQELIVSFVQLSKLRFELRKCLTLEPRKNIVDHNSVFYECMG